MKVVTAAMLAVAAAPALAQSPVAAPVAACKLDTFATGTVKAVLDARTLALDDGRELVLAAIEVPSLHDGVNAAPAAAAAKSALETLLAGKALLIKRLGLERDRYNRLSGQVFLNDGPAERWIQAEMVARGHAFAAARVGDVACARLLLARETAARDARLGLWGDPYYVIIKADDPVAVLARRGRFGVVEGKVVSVRESGGTIYVNFGRRWSTDFTVTIAKRNARTFADAGLEPKSLAGRLVRVRGFIEERGGPWIDAVRPEQIELVDRLATRRK